MRKAGIVLLLFGIASVLGGSLQSFNTSAYVLSLCMIIGGMTLLFLNNWCNLSYHVNKTDILALSCPIFGVVSFALISGKVDVPLPWLWLLPILSVGSGIAYGVRNWKNQSWLFWRPLLITGVILSVIPLIFLIVVVLAASDRPIRRGKHIFPSYGAV